MKEEQFEPSHALCPYEASWGMSVHAGWFPRGKKTRLHFICPQLNRGETFLCPAVKEGWCLIALLTTVSDEKKPQAGRGLCNEKPTHGDFGGKLEVKARANKENGAEARCSHAGQSHRAWLLLKQVVLFIRKNRGV